MNQAQVLIIGAGIAGLAAAIELETNGISTILLDKSSSVGGRLATRRIANGQADHGAQFFTVRTDAFQQQVDRWVGSGVVKIWTHGWSDGSLKRTVGDGHARYVATKGMNDIAKHMQASLTKTQVKVNSRVGRLEVRDNRVHAICDDGTEYSADAVLLTPPPPQALQLLDELPLTEDDRDALNRIHYGPCLTGLHVVEGDVNLPEPGAVQDFNNTVYWIGSNRSKGITDSQIITTHAEARWSRQHYDAPDSEVLETLRKALLPYLMPGANIVEEQVKRWRYSVPLTTHPQEYLALSNLPVVFAGDGFGGRGRIEGAYLSGVSAGRKLVEIVN